MLLGLGCLALLRSYCNLTGTWRWPRDPSLGIKITMAPASAAGSHGRFDVVLDPPGSAWGGARGALTPLWNGTCAVGMNTTAGTGRSSYFYGYVYDDCSVIDASGLGPTGKYLWLRNSTGPATPPPTPPPAPTSPTPAPVPPAPTPAPTPAREEDGADVTWHTASADVLGSMPLGNGALGVNVWVEQQQQQQQQQQRQAPTATATASLLPSLGTVHLLVSHADALDENGVLSKLGRVVIDVAAATGAPATAPAAAAPAPAITAPPYTALSGFTGAASGAIGAAPCPGGQLAGCVAASESRCEAEPGCAGFALSPLTTPPAATLFGAPAVAAGGRQFEPSATLFVAAEPTPGTATALSARVEYRLSNGTVTIRLSRRTVSASASTNASTSDDAAVLVHVWVDATRPVVRVASESLGPLPHALTARLELWRNATRFFPGEGTKPIPDNGAFCNGSDVFQHADVLMPAPLPLSPPPASGVAATLAAVGWYHRNDPAWTGRVAADAVAQQVPAAVAAALPNPLANLTWGGVVAVEGGAVAADGGGAAAGPLGATIATAPSLSHAVHIGGGVSDAVASGEQLVSDLAAALPAAGGGGVTPAQARAAHGAWWRGFWSSSELDVRAAAAPADAVLAAAAANVTRNDRITRASFAAQTRGNAPEHRGAGFATGRNAIKFNHYGIFSALPPPYEDNRVWGPCQWFQNIRLPYYSMLADGRLEEMKSLFEFYASVLPVSRARVAAWFGHAGAFFPETMSVYGAYAGGEQGWGCTGMGGGVAEPTPANPYIRYHREGGLELSALALDWAEHAQDWAYFNRTLLPQVTAYVEYYNQHFNGTGGVTGAGAGNGNDTGTRTGTGALDMFPAQALETWQCANPTDRANCVTNPAPEVAALRALLPRLVALDGSPTSPAGGAFAAPVALRERWAALLARVPPLPLSSSSSSSAGAGAAAGGGEPAAAAVLLSPGERLPAKMSNAENPELYAVHPYRLVGLLANTSLGVATYTARRHHGNTGWSQDAMDAALLGLRDEAPALVAERANLPPYAGYRWPGFQAGIGAGGPITDHGGVTSAALRYLLLHTGLNGGGGAPTSRRIVLFAAWPCADWAVDFRLHAPGATVVAGSYDGAGRLSNFSVVPRARAADVTFAGCVNASAVEWAP